MIDRLFIVFFNLVVRSNFTYTVLHVFAIVIVLLKSYHDVNVEHPCFAELFSVILFIHGTLSAL